MPVSWTPENDSKMFVALLNVLEGPIPHALIAEQLKKMGLVVTNKAVSHRIAKLKNDAKAGKAPTYASRNLTLESDVFATPKTPKVSKKGTDSGTPNTETKRKRVMEDIGFHADDRVRLGSSGYPVSKKPMRVNEFAFSMENADYPVDNDNTVNPQLVVGSSFTPIDCSTDVPRTKGSSPILKPEEDEGHYADVSDMGEYYVV